VRNDGYLFSNYGKIGGFNIEPDKLISDSGNFYMCANGKWVSFGNVNFRTFMSIGETSS
jgi:hypothetical protein